MKLKALVLIPIALLGVKRLQQLFPDDPNPTPLIPTTPKERDLYFKKQAVMLRYIAAGLIDPTVSLSSSFLLEYDFSDDEVTQPEPYTLSQTGNIAQYGLSESVFGTAVYGSTGSNLIRQPVEGSGFTVAAKILDATSNSPVALKGFEMEFTAGGRR